MLPLPIDVSTYSFDPIFVNGALGTIVNIAKHSNSPWASWVKEESKKTIYFAHIVVASLSAAGMSFTYQFADDGSLAVTLSGLTLSSVFSFLFTTFKNLGAQGSVSWVLDKGRDLIEIKRDMTELKSLLSPSESVSDGNVVKDTTHQ